MNKTPNTSNTRTETTETMSTTNSSYSNSYPNQTLKSIFNNQSSLNILKKKLGVGKNISNVSDVSDVFDFNTLNKRYTNLKNEYNKNKNISLDTLISLIYKDIINYPSIYTLNSFMERIGIFIYTYLKYYLKQLINNATNRPNVNNTNSKNNLNLLKNIRECTFIEEKVRDIIDYFRILKLMVKYVGYIVNIEKGEKIMNLLYWYYYQYCILTSLIQDDTFRKNVNDLTKRVNDLTELKKRDNYLIKIKGRDNNSTERLKIYYIEIIKEEIVKFLGVVYRNCFMLLKRKLHFTCLKDNCTQEIQKEYNPDSFFRKLAIFERSKPNNEKPTIYNKLIPLSALHNNLSEILHQIFTMKYNDGYRLPYSDDIYNHIMNIFKYIEDKYNFKLNKSIH